MLMDFISVIFLYKCTLSCAKKQDFALDSSSPPRLCKNSAVHLMLQRPFFNNATFNIFHRVDYDKGIGINLCQVAV